MAFGWRGSRKHAPGRNAKIRPGALFLVGDPKQAIYRFRGADVATYLTAKNALAEHDPSSILEISANFRSQPSILQFVNDNFASMLDVAQGQPGFSALAPVRKSGAQSAVATFDILIEQRHRNDRGLIAKELRREESATRRRHRPAPDRVLPCMGQGSRRLSGSESRRHRPPGADGDQPLAL